MNFKNLNFYTFLVTILSLSLISCSDDDDGPGQTPEGSDTFEIIADSPDHETLEQALRDTGLDETLNDGVYTVFAPTDEAFNNVDLSGLSNDQLTNILLNHVLAGETFFQAPAGSTQTTFSTGFLDNLSTGDNFKVHLNIEGDLLLNGKSKVTVPDELNANNGVVHVVNEVILPLTSTFDVIAESPNHNTLEQALVDTGLDQVLNSGDFTIFAPTDAAFNEVDLSGLSDTQLTNVLLNHVLTGTILSTDLSTTYVKTNATEMITGDANPLDLYINLDDGVTLNGAATVTTPDVIGNNGVVHVTDAVIPMPDITTFATADPTFENLAAALTRDDQPDFVDVLSTPNGTDPAPFTVFAPTNDAFANLLSNQGFDSLADVPQDLLESTLNSHVVAGVNVRAADLTNGPVQTLGAELMVNASDATLTDPNGRVSNIIVTDVQTTNGVIHAIDTVVLPQL